MVSSRKTMCEQDSLYEHKLCYVQPWQARTSYQYFLAAVLDDRLGIRQAIRLEGGKTLTRLGIHRCSLPDYRAAALITVRLQVRTRAIKKVHIIRACHLPYYCSLHVSTRATTSQLIAGLPAHLFHRQAMDEKSLEFGVSFAQDREDIQI